MAVTFPEFTRELLRRGASRPVMAANVVVLPTVPSTNALARRIAQDYLREGMAVPPVVVVAWGQSGGRGRWGRTWSSLPGRGLYVSLVIPVEEQEGLAVLPLLVGIGLARALDRHLVAAGGAGCGLKWPNDLVVGGRKLGGVLIEAVSGEEGQAAVIGFGVNQSQTADELAEAVADVPGRRATSLAVELAGTPAALPELAPLAWELIDGVRAELAHWGEVDYAARGYAGLSIHRPGDRLVVRTGDETLAGTFLGFDRHGLLRLDLDGRERKLSAGEVMGS